jgi:hypothetical protein
MAASLRRARDRGIVLNERHLTRLLYAYWGHYYGYRTHRALDMDTPIPRPVPPPEPGRVRQVPEGGGLHHHDERITA